MMINKRLIQIVPDSKTYILKNVFFQWIGLLFNIVCMVCISSFLATLYLQHHMSWELILIAIVCLLVKCGMTYLSSKMSFLSGKEVKTILRKKLYEKLLNLSNSYKENVQTSEVVQVCVEGVNQLETYFESYLPQFFYSLLAPLTLFVVLCFVNVPSAVVLLVCVPLIPISIAVVQTWAKKLLGKYWDQYTQLGDSFLENLQGLTTLKIYQADARKHEQMNEEAENFRKITMKVLTMQLNSITIMDLVAYGGAALGMIMAVNQFRAGHVSLMGSLLIVLLAADFFLPMRLLGSYFHIAMNGMAASDKIFKVLDLQEPDYGSLPFEMKDIHARNVSFAYESTPVLKSIDFDIPKNSCIAFVGESGCGKSTLANVLMKKNRNYSGSIQMGTCEWKDLQDASLLEHVAYISAQSFIFQTTVRENLLIGDESKMIDALKQVNLWDFLQSQDGLDTMCSNFSGGQRQRLALARAIVHDRSFYIFDEATSNIDVESENDIVEQMYELAKEKTVIMISHRLANVSRCDCIYVMDQGNIVESGSHEDLLKKQGVYATLWNTQQELEKYVKGEQA